MAESSHDHQIIQSDNTNQFVWNGNSTYSSGSTAVAIGNTGYTVTFDHRPPQEPEGPLAWLESEVERMCALGRKV